MGLLGQVVGAGVAGSGGWCGGGGGGYSDEVTGSGDLERGHFQDRLELSSSHIDEKNKILENKRL